METAELWAGEFGNEYHARNRVDWRRRIPFWRNVLNTTGARSVYEWGCGPGWNLSAIKAGAEWPVEVYGQEINEGAVNQGCVAGLDIFEEGTSFNFFEYELTCTVGALIHVPPQDLRARMQWMVQRSCDYVFAVEYRAEKEEMIMYRGEPDRLWKRPYGLLYQDLGLRLVDVRDAGIGFDNCTAWLFRK